MWQEHVMCYTVFILLLASMIVSQTAAWTTTTTTTTITYLAPTRASPLYRVPTTTTTPTKRVSLSTSFRLYLATDKDDDKNDWGTDDDDISQQTFLAPTKEQPDRDLFIPIFALISLSGLFGTYAFEMVRLWSRGELYLPWS